MNKRSGIETKQKILKSAMYIFSRHGYERANIRQIAKYAGISVGGVYLYFRNKEELYLSFMKEMMRRLSIKIDEIAMISASPSKALEAFIRFYIKYAIKHKELIFIHLRDVGFAFGMEAKKEFFKKQQKEIEKIIINGIRAGEFRRCNVHEMAKTIMCALRGAILSMVLDKDGIIEPKRITEFVLNGLAIK